MEVYDRAHELARALTKSREYNDFRLSRAKLESDPANLKMLQDFRRRQLDLEMALIGGKEPEPAAKEALEESYRIISLNPAITAYLASEARIAKLLQDIQKILIDALPDWGQKKQETDEDKKTR